MNRDLYISILNVYTMKVDSNIISYVIHFEIDACVFQCYYQELNQCINAND